MKKNLLLFFSVALIMISCEKKSGTYTAVIPSDVTALISLDTKGMIQKSGVSEDQRTEFIAKLMTELRHSMDDTSTNALESFLRDPETVGISASDRTYIFALAAEAEQTAVLMSIKDRSKLEETFSTLAKGQTATPITQANAYSWVILGEKTVCGFDDHSMLIMIAQDESQIEQIKQTYNTLFTLKPEKSITSAKNFQKMTDQQYDIEFIVATKEAYKMMLSSIYSEMLSTSGFQFEDLYFIGGINFEKGRVAMRVENFSENPKTVEMFEKQTAIYGKLGSTFIDYYPATTLLYAAAKLNGAAICDLFQQNQRLEKALNQDIIKIISSIKGDISLGVTAIPSNMPMISLYAEVENDAIIKYIMDNQKEMKIQIQQNSENDYTITSYGIEVYFGMADNFVYFTNDKSAHKEIGKGVKDALSKSQWATTIKKSNSYMLLNIDQIMKQAVVKELLSMGLGRNGGKVVTALEQLSYVETFSASPLEMQMNICVKNENENILKVIIDQTAGW